MPSNLSRNLVQERRQLAVSELTVNKVVQRRFDQKHAEAIAKDYHPVGVNDLVVAQVNNGSKKHYIVDGQHTRWVLERVGVQMAWCRIIKVQTKREINEVFQLINRGSKSLTPLESFILNAENDTDSMDHKAEMILLDRDMSVDYSDVEGKTIQCAGAIRDSYKALGPELFKTAADLFGLVLDSGEKLDVFAARAITSLVKKHGNDFALSISEVIAAEFPTLKASAKEKVIGTHPANKPMVLVDEIESAAFAPRVNFSTVKFPMPKKRIVS